MQKEKRETLKSQQNSKNVYLNQFSLKKINIQINNMLKIFNKKSEMETKTKNSFNS